jgi:Spy/CpxP family protein refolding chaperone
MAAIMLLSAAFAQAAQPLTVKRGFNDPETLVAQRLNAMPRSLNLTSKQRDALRRIYLELSEQEQRISFEPGPFILKRQKVKALNDRCERKVRAVLSAKQYRNLKKWEKSSHRPVHHARP